VATGRSIVELVREKQLLSEKEIAEILDPKRMTEPQIPLKAAKKRDAGTVDREQGSGTESKVPSPSRSRAGSKGSR
jgi:hypothetical protein